VLEALKRRANADKAIRMQPFYFLYALGEGL